MISLQGEIIRIWLYGRKPLFEYIIYTSIREKPRSWMTVIDFLFSVKYKKNLSRWAGWIMGVLKPSKDTLCCLAGLGSFCIWKKWKDYSGRQLLLLTVAKNERSGVGFCPLHGNNISRNKEMLCSMGFNGKGRGCETSRHSWRYWVHRKNKTIPNLFASYVSLEGPWWT